MHHILRNLIQTLAVLLLLIPNASPLFASSNVILVGDSVMSALNQSNTNCAKTVIAAANWNVKIDAKPCRCATTPGCKKGTPESVKNVLLARRDLAGSALVIMVGHNDARNESFKAKIDNILHASQKASVVFWVTMREVSDSYRRVNKMLIDETDHRKNLRIVHWAKASNDQPSWVAKDGVHLSTLGARKLAETITRELNAWRSSN